MSAEMSPERIRTILRRLAGSDAVVDIRRHIHACDPVIGTVVEVGARRVLVRQLGGFTIDGYAVLSVSDIHRIWITESERWKRRHVRAGIVAPESPIRVDLRSWPSVFRSIQDAGRLAIVECECPGDQDWDLAAVLRVDRGGAELQSYDPAGRAWPFSTRWAFQRVTCVTIQSRYVDVFERHRRGRIPAPRRGEPLDAWPPDVSGADTRSPSTMLALLNVAQRNGWSVSISRSSGRRKTLYGRVVDASSRLLLLARVEDFEFDGWTIVPLSDVASVRRRQADKFHDRVLDAEGRVAPRSPPIDLTDWTTALRDLSASQIPLGVSFGEDELVVGRIDRVLARTVRFLPVSAIGRWWPGTVSVAYRTITSVDVGRDYERVIVEHAQGRMSHARTSPRT